MIYYAITSTINRFEKLRKYLGWFIYPVVYIKSILTWLSKEEYIAFSDCLFHAKKTAQQPWIGERTIEYAWAYKHIKEVTKCNVLDVGAKNGLLITDMLLAQGNMVYTLDINTSSAYQQGNLTVERGDIISTKYEDGYFDAILLISTLEHIGVGGRYGITKNDENMDFLAMKEVYRLLKPGGKCFITVPYGKGKSLPMNRLYNQDRCNRLFRKYKVLSAQYFVFDEIYKLWLDVSEGVAGKQNWDHSSWYALACFFLLKP